MKSEEAILRELRGLRVRNNLRELRGLRVRNSLRGLRVFLLGALCATGCVSFDATDARRSQTEAFTNELSRLEAAWLAEPLTLERCVRIAMTNNYEVRKADLDAQLGRFSRDMAFSAFLPQVSASATRIDYDRNPVLNSQRFTSGGVDVKRVDPRTMMSKLVDGLYFAGEVLDVDAYTGGFNLQIAWATGRCAGMSAGKDIHYD